MLFETLKFTLKFTFRLGCKSIDSIRYMEYSHIIILNKVFVQGK